MDQNKLWKAALGQLELRISRGNFLTWFRDTTIQDVKKGMVVVETPSAFAHEWLSRKYREPILEVLQDLDKKVLEVDFVIRSQTTAKRPLKRNARILAQKKRVVEAVATARPAPEPQTKTTPFTKTLNDKYTFESFIIGPNNEVAHAACRAVASKPGTAYNPLFLYGGVGLGKTHLLHAVGNVILAERPEARVLYVSSEKFINDFVQAIRDRDTAAFKALYRGVDVLMIDDVQFLAGKGKTQEELFHTFNALHSQNKQIVLSSDRSPKGIPTMEERLRSRLAGGMLIDIQQPDYETRLAIVEEKALQHKDTVIDPESLAFIAKNIQKNVRELEGALNRVVAHCALNNKRATLEYTEQILDGVLEKPQQKTVASDKILDVVSVYYSISLEDLCGKRRKQEIVRPRQVAMYLLRHENNVSFPSIGEQFGGRDHTTAMHACEKIGKLLEHDDELVKDLNFIRERLYA